jgi:transcriptional regulator with PAS, ATPase and Fis domain
LIFVGSSENQFADAGRVFALDDVRTVRFGRGRNELSSELAGTVLHVSIPLGWVSGAHAELRIVPASGSVEFDLRDLGSRNGTHIERQPIPGIARLKSGQVFEVGRSFWMVREVTARELEPAHVDVLDVAGTSNPGLCAVQRTLKRLSTSEVPLLLGGETGTGKEVTARAIHRASGRAGPFVTGNLAALSDVRVDAALLGYKKGAFPGAEEDQPGLFEAANGGTLFFDELGELSGTVQSKLLAALTESQTMRLGETQPRKFEVRTICASLHDVHSMVLGGTFRPDLYSRLAGFQAELPPLRSRREDLGVLTKALCRNRGMPVRVSTRAFRRILAYDWPYNVRELEQTIATASILAGSDGEITREVIDEIVERRSDMPRNPETVRELRAQLVDQLARTGGDTAEMARAMDRDQKEIQRWIERFELQTDAYKAPTGEHATEAPEPGSSNE